MNPIFASLFLLLAENTGSSGSGSSSEQTSSGTGASEKLTETLKNMVKSPIFYVVIGVIVLLIIVFYLLRRIVKPANNAVKVITRKGKVHKLIDYQSDKYFLTPFIDRVAAVISLNEQELSSDQLFINNGPDALYKINFTIKYKVTNPEEFFKYHDQIKTLLLNSLNEDLREYADNGNALVLIKEYREHSQDILDLINKSISKYSVVASSYKVNFIEPLGRK